jgi:peptide/nickel transport system substrate-binding protein
MKSTKSLAAISMALVGALSLSGCAGVNQEPITIGVGTYFTTIDPAGSWNIADQEIMHQVYTPIFNSLPGQEELEGEIAQSWEFESEKVFVVKLKDGLTFANGNQLDSSDVVYSFDRLRGIASPAGPVGLISNVESVVARDNLTLEYNLKVANDQALMALLSSVASLVVDEEVFPEGELLANEAIVDAQAFSGQYVINSIKQDEFVSYVPNPGYKGLLGPAKNSGVVMRYFSDVSNLVLEAKSGNLDVVMGWRSLDAKASSEIEKQGYTLAKGVGVEPNFLALDFRNMPFGTETDTPDAAKALAVRQALAHVIDKQSFADNAHFGMAEVATSIVPSAIPGSFDAMTALYGDGQGGPSLDKAKQVLASAGIEEPLDLEIAYSPDRYGASVIEQVIDLADQLNQSGLFTLSLKAMEWSAFREARTNGQLASWHQTWGPDYTEVDNYVTPLIRSDLNFIRGAYVNTEVDALIYAQLSEPDFAKRSEILKQIQEQLALDLPAIPMLSTDRFALVKSGINGVAETFDVSYKFRLGNISR